MNKNLSIEKIFGNAINYHQQKDLFNAELNYIKILEIDPFHIGSLNNLGLILINKKKFKESIILFKKIIDKDPKYKSAYNNLGFIYKESDNPEKAIKCFEKALVIDDNYFEAHNNLGLIYKSLKKNQKAIISYKKALAIKPNYYDALNNLGILLYEIGEFEESEKYFQKALIINPNFTEVNCNIGLVYEKLGNLKGALNSYQKVKKDDKNFITAQYSLASLLYNDKQYIKAAQIFKNLEFKNSKNYLLKIFFKLNDKENFFKLLDIETKKGRTNAIIGSLITSSKIRYGVKKKNLFCEKPLDYVYIKNLNLDLNFKKIFIDTCENILNDKNFRDRSQSLLVNSIQSAGNIFQNRNSKVEQIKNIIVSEIENYYYKFKNQNDGIIKSWPKNFNLNGWLVSMKNGGKIKPHIHDYGWLSGSIYINVPPKNLKNSGDLIVSLSDDERDINNTNYSKIINVTTGSLCLFPSSLYHYTVPFASDERRIVLAFDMI